MKNTFIALLLVLFFGIDAMGQEIYPYRSSDGKFGYKEKSGKVVIPARYDRAFNFSDGLAVVVIDGMAGYIDPQGALVIASGFDMAGSFSQGLGSFPVVTTRCGPFPEGRPR